MLAAPLDPYRRALFLGGLCALALGRAACAELRSPAGGRLAFAAFRNGRRIGEQTMTFAPSASGLDVHTLAEFTVKLGPVTLYRYRHEATERWRDGAFASLESRTLANGKAMKVSATRTSGGVMIEPASGPATKAPAAALPFSHWNRAIAKAPLFNPQDGKLVRETVKLAGSGQVQLADGRSITAERIVFGGEAQIEDWYDSDGIWTGLRGKLKDGSLMEYRRL